VEIDATVGFRYIWSIGNLDTELRDEGTLNPGHYHGLPAKREEVVVGGHVIAPELPAPVPRTLSAIITVLLVVMRRRCGRCETPRPARPVHFPCGLSGMRSDAEQPRRHHVARQRLEQPGSHVALLDAVGRRDEERDQLRLTSVGVRGHHGSLPDLGQPGERALDLGRVDAHAPHLHLRVQPAGDDEVPRRGHVTAIARAVQRVQFAVDHDRG